MAEHREQNRTMPTHHPRRPRRHCLTSPGPMAGLPALLTLLLALSMASIPSALSNSCPFFAPEQDSCGASTCGHYIYRGRFETRTARPFLLPTIPNGIKLGRHSQPSDCCHQCRTQDACGFWNFFPGTGLCLLYTGGLCNSTGASIYTPGLKDAFIGGRCHSQDDSSAAQSTTTTAAPVATAGTKPIPSKSFCLLSDTGVHLNILLGGYLDSRALDQKEATKKGKGVRRVLFSKSKKNASSETQNHLSPAVRVWIRELAVMWGKAGPGQAQHVLRLQARNGSSSTRGAGFMGRVELDGAEMPRISLGDEINLFEGQASLTFDSQRKEGHVEVDVYKLRIEEVLEATIRLRPVHPLLQQPGDAMVHIVVDVTDLAYSPTVHGVLGQFYKNNRREQTLDYKLLSSLMEEPFSLPAAKPRTPMPMEGDVGDYATSDVASPDCMFSQFMLAPLHQILDQQIELEMQKPKVQY